eukprot:5725535-Pleurochrysis_carterae.AAC.2
MWWSVASRAAAGGSFVTVTGGLVVGGATGAADVVVGGDAVAEFGDASWRMGTSDCKCVAMTRAKRNFKSGGDAARPVLTRRDVYFWAVVPSAH